MNETKKPSPEAPSHEESETFSFRLPALDARMLKALAELEGLSVGELTARALTVVVRDRMVAIAHRIIKNAENRLKSETLKEQGWSVGSGNGGGVQWEK